MFHSRMLRSLGRPSQLWARQARSRLTKIETQIQPNRTLKISANAISGLSKWGPVINVLAGVYIGGLIVSLGSFYFIYHDANSRERIPFELSFQDQMEAVLAINKDDVLEKPRFAVKHYRKLLMHLAKETDPSLDESEYPGFVVPVIDAETLVYHKSNKFSNFYIDLILRYSKALLAKGELDAAIHTLTQVIDNDLIYYKIGDAERLSGCSRLLASVYADPQDRVHTLQRSIDMLSKTYSSIQLNDDYTLQKNTKVSDELISCLNDLAFQLAQIATSPQSKLSKSQRSKQLNESLAIYLSNLQALTTMRESLELRKTNQSHYPLFNVHRENLITQISAIKAHISEILWYEGAKQKAVSWSEEVLKEIYYDNASSARVQPILENVLDNLIQMYTKMRQPQDVERCKELKSEMSSYARGRADQDGFDAWYDALIKRWSGVLYDQGPLGIIVKPLSERFGPEQRIRPLEEFEKEDE
ncbi:uncharacterized protein LODBEIA_P27520 [Lodderomyces beijingensis]|uniref:Uncharacterized protein n=1 Tax=Lodderomyces beijingensis TaxID=1775926 RepID=A0ABP0ZK45_9ASCO